MFKSMQHIFDNFRDIFRAATGQEQDPHQPQKGMTWYVVHERSIPHSYRGYSDPLSSVQIVGLDETKIELLDNVYYHTVQHQDWQEHYDHNFRRARSAFHTPGGGSFVPHFMGVQPVNESFVEMRRNPSPLPRPGY